MRVRQQGDIPSMEGWGGRVDGMGDDPVPQTAEGRRALLRAINVAVRLMIRKTQRICQASEHGGSVWKTWNR
jgi:hypothetical protein